MQAVECRTCEIIRDLHSLEVEALEDHIKVLEHREARAERALGLATIIAVVGWLGFWAMCIARWL